MATKTNPKKATLETFLPVIARDVSSIKLSVIKLAKIFEAEKKAQLFARQRQRAEEYGAKFKKATPTRAEKKVVTENKKGFFDTIKEGLENLFKFALIGLASIGLAKLLNVPGAVDGVTSIVKKMIIGISEVLQKGISFLKDIINDGEVRKTIFNLAKSLFTFIADAITTAADFFSSFVSDPENQRTLKEVLVAIVGGIVSAIKGIFSVGKDLLSENSDAIKEGAIGVFLVIKDVIVGVLKGAQSALQDPTVKAAIMDITNAVLNLVGQILSTEVFEIAGQKITLKQVIIAFGAAVIALGLAFQGAMGYVRGLGEKSIRGTGKGGASGKGGPKGMGKYATAGNVLTLGALAYGGYEFFTDDKTDRPTNQADAVSTTSTASVSPAPAAAPAPAPTVSRPYPSNTPANDTRPSKPYPTTSTPNTSRPSRVAPMMPKSLEEYIDIEFERKKAREGFKNKAYASPEGGTDSVGIGHKLTKEEQEAGGVFIGGKLVKVDRNTPLTDDQVKELYRQDIMKHAAAARQKINKLAGEDVWSRLNPMQQYALMDLSFAGGPGLITKDLADAIKAGDMEKAAQLIQQKARTYRKNGQVVESRHLASHADLRADVFRGIDPLLGGEQPMVVASATTPSVATKGMSFASGGATSSEGSGHEYSPGGGSSSVEKPKGIMDSVIASISDGLASLDEATGGKLGFASAELQSILRDKSFLSSMQSPIVADMGKNISTSDNVAIDEKIPSVYDDVILSKLSRV